MSSLFALTIKINLFNSIGVTKIGIRELSFGNLQFKTMKDTTEILQRLRELMQQKAQVAAYIVPSDDEHQSEYISDHDMRRAFISGFDGSAGTAVITAEKALLWTDGRYYQQAEKQLDSNWTLMREGLPTTPSIGNFLGQTLSKEQEPRKVGVDPKLVSTRLWKSIQKELCGFGCQLVPVNENLVDIVWGSAQCPRTCNPIISLDLKFAGQTVQEKWEQIKQQMLEKRTQALVVSALDEIAWFLNLRGTDIDYNPVFFAYLIVTQNEILLFVDSAKLPDNFADYLKANNVTIAIHPYDVVSEHLSHIVTVVEKIWISPTSSYYLSALIPKEKRHPEITPIALAKAIKNPTEVEGFINCHVRDGVALCQFFAWLEAEIEKGTYIDEISAATHLEGLRSKKAHFMGLSFPTISSSGPNASVIHYHPSAETNRQINKQEIYLCDSGAQYKDGTTDVTRTVHLGAPSDEQKEAYTRVLKGQLTLGATVFPAKVKGMMLDTIARKALWDIGWDYGHGTGHGVGHFLNVHEGPMGVGIRPMPDDPGLQENMIISNEPGYYKDGEYGIRIEDLVQIVPSTTTHNFAGRGALTFKTITMCPKQTKMIKKELLSEVELKLLNDYHRQVRETLMPILEKEGDATTMSWLQRETQPL